MILLAKSYIKESRGVFMYFVKSEPVDNIITRRGDIIVYMDFITDILAKSIIIRATVW